MNICIQTLQDKVKEVITELNGLVVTNKCYPYRRKRLEQNLRDLRIGITELKKD